VVRGKAESRKQKAEMGIAPSGERGAGSWEWGVPSAKREAESAGPTPKTEVEGRMTGHTGVPPWTAVTS